MKKLQWVVEWIFNSLPKALKQDQYQLNKLILLAYGVGQKFGSLELFSVICASIAETLFQDILMIFFLCSLNNSQLLGSNIIIPTFLSTWDRSFTYEWYSSPPVGKIHSIEIDCYVVIITEISCNTL